MKKNILLLLFLVPIALVAIEISGVQSGSWDAVNNPHLLIGDVTVPDGEELLVNQGVEVIAQGNYKITAEGIILIQGTVTDSVIFYGNNGLYWGGLRLESTTGCNLVNYCRISNTNDDNNYAVHSVASAVLIENSVFNDHKKAVAFSGISTDLPPSMEIRKSGIYNCEQNGILITDNSNAVVDSCEITLCGLGTQYRGAIQLALQTANHNCSPQISNNWIHHNGKQGIIMGNLFNYSEMSPDFINNVVEFNLTGVYLFNAGGIYRDNRILNNYELGNTNSGAGVMLWGSGADGTFTGNEISGNFTGFYLGDGATANLGNIWNGSDLDDGMNYIHDNVDQSGNLYSIYNISDQDVMAQNNIWDSFDPAEIAETIIDGQDNPGYGNVNFQPMAELEFPEAVGLACEIMDDIAVLSWSEPDISFPLILDNYAIYLDDDLIEESIDTLYVLEGLINGQTYEAGVAVIYNLGISAMAMVEFVYTGAAIIDQEIPAAVALLSFPNPFQHQVEISYRIVDAGHKLSGDRSDYSVKLGIYNVKGQLVKILVKESEPSGIHGVVWDGRDLKGVPVASGNYLCRLNVGDRQFCRRICLIK